MKQKYQVYQILPEYQALETEQTNEDGYLRKFWVEHPQLSRSLVKLDESGAENWTEKVAYEIGKCMNLPIAQYELATIKNFSEYTLPTNAIISPNFKIPGVSYVDATDYIFQLTESYYSNYNIDTILAVLQNELINLPPNYNPPANINNGLDLWAGYTLFDGLIANNDRHGRNWAIGINPKGEKHLAPLYDNGSSFAISVLDIIYVDTPHDYADALCRGILPSSLIIGAIEQTQLFCSPVYDFHGVRGTANDPIL